MSGKDQKKATTALEEKLELLRDVTKSSAANETSILVDASKYIKELKDKVSQEPEQLGSTSSSMPMPRVSVSSVELEKKRGFRINVSMEKSQPELLTSVLEAFEELGLDVLDADVSCADDTAFRLEALGSSQSEAAETSVDEQMVRHAVLQAIKKCIDGSSI
ncbi:basic helix-loop-helix protein 004-like [Oryza glaberrima]|uniref:Plant bHLH transcription factor ACT-like domain-containing protein n=2 Tax=Oryza TaxID=4527 RepID=A0A0E0BEK3_9ORYZ|nr:basic helix-loop-helix protein 004-like [Oryza glaberrima]